MSDDTDILKRVHHLPAQERAAALAHWIYIKACHQDQGWSTRVTDAWEDLKPRAREFNLVSIDTWARSPQVLAAWVDALSEYRKEKGA